MRRVVQESVFLRLPKEQGGDVPAGMDSLTGREPTPEFAAEVSDTCDALLALPDDKSRQIALLKLERHTSDEIAAKLGCTRRTVQRKLLVIRRTWQHAVGIESVDDDVSQSDGEQALED